MSGTILTGPAGSGKTSTVIDRILETEEAAFWNEIWVLLPTRLQNEAFRDKLLDRADSMPGREALSTVFNIRFFEFYELYDTLLDLAGSPQRTIRGAASDRILRHVIDELSDRDALPYYAEIASRPGFVGLVSGLIKELKQGLVLPEYLVEIAHSRAEKDRDLSRIYSAYQRFLMESGLVDRDGAGWVAAAELRRNPDLARHVRLMVVDGFDSFTPLQVHLLTLLSDQIEETLLTLTYEEHRAGDAGRVFARTLENLRDTGYWSVRQHEISAQLPRSEPLAHLERSLFALNAKAAPAGDALKLINAPDPRDEVRAVLRRVKRLLLDGVHPEQIAIVIRDVDRYANLLRSTAAAYGLPVVVRQAEQLTDNPAVKAVLQLIDLHSLDYPRRHMLDVLHSPYLDAPDFSAAHIDDLARVSMERPIVGGRAAWLEGLSARPGRDEDGEARYEVDHPDELEVRTRDFFARTTPPASALAHEYVAWIEDLLGPDPAAFQQDSADFVDEESPFAREHFDLYGQIRGNSDLTVAVRDLYAMQGLRGALSEVLGAYDLLADSQPMTIQWDAFRADLELAIRERTISDEAHRSRVGRVLITTVFEARGLPHDHLFIMGLAEGIFPARQSEDALYSDLERDELEALDIRVEASAARNKDQGLFYEMCALAQQTLTLSRPTRDDSGNDWAESVFWKRATEVLVGAGEETLRVGEVPPLEQAASQRELIVSLSHALSQPDALKDSALRDALGALQDQSIWANVLRGRQIEMTREAAGLPFDEFSGVLRDPTLLAEVQRMLGPDKKWSATQFNDLGLCAFRFFSRRMLKLEPYLEPESGLDALQLGSLNHKILEETYARIRTENLTICAKNVEAAVDILGQEASRIMATAPQEFGFHAPAFWDQQKDNIFDKLERLVRLDFSPDSPVRKLIDSDDRIPAYLEAAFGYGDAPLLKIDGAAGPLLARGFIDRMDAVDGDVVIVDYKSGSSTPSKKDMADGRNYQMLLYLLAADQLLGGDARLRGGLFWSIQKNAIGVAITIDDEAVEMARHMLHQQVIAARGGFFPNQPAKMTEGKCVHYCEFSQFCRLTRASLRKSAGS